MPSGGVAGLPVALGERGELVGGQREQSPDEHRLRDAARAVLGGLERLARRLGEAVEVEAVVPVGPADERQAMGPEAVERVAQRPAQVLAERRLGAGLVGVGDRLVEDGEVAGLLGVRGDGEDEPQRVVVEPRPDGVVAGLRERLVLVVGAAARELGRGDVEDPLARPLRNHRHEAEQVLVRVAEAHAAADARLERRRRARQVERDHALVGVPHVDHAVDVLGRGRDLQRAEQVAPAVPQPLDGHLDLAGAQEAVDDRPRPSACRASPIPAGRTSRRAGSPRSRARRRRLASRPARG